MAKTKTAKIQAKSTALATPRASPRVKAKITKAESKKKELFKDSAGKLVDLTEWVDTEAFDMALHSINRQHPELDIGAVLNYRESRLQEFADSKDFEIINVCGDGSCAVRALHASEVWCFGFIHLRCCHLSGNARGQTVLLLHSRPVFGNFLRRWQRGITYSEVAEVFKENEFLIDAALAYLAFVFNVRL